MLRSKLPKDKIKLTEEYFSLPDGRKAMILFYVCSSADGMVALNYFDCQIVMESESDKNILQSCWAFMDGGAPDISPEEAIAWKDYFKKMLLTLRENQ